MEIPMAFILDPIPERIPGITAGAVAGAMRPTFLKDRTIDKVVDEIITQIQNRQNTKFRENLQISDETRKELKQIISPILNTVRSVSERLFGKLYDSFPASIGDAIFRNCTIEETKTPIFKSWIIRDHTKLKQVVGRAFG